MKHKQATTLCPLSLWPPLARILPLSHSASAQAWGGESGKSFGFSENSIRKNRFLLVFLGLVARNLSVVGRFGALKAQDEDRKALGAQLSLSGRRSALSCAVNRYTMALNDLETSRLGQLLLHISTE